MPQRATGYGWAGDECDSTVSLTMPIPRAKSHHRSSYRYFTKVSIGNSALMRNTNAARGGGHGKINSVGFEVLSQDLILASDHL